MARVVRPGGRVVVLEITTPTRAAAVASSTRCGSTASCRRSAASQARSRARARGAARRRRDDREAYTYLPNSVKRFPAPAALAAEMERAGLAEISYVITAGGIVAIHAGTVPRRAAHHERR